MRKIILLLTFVTFFLNAAGFGSFKAPKQDFLSPKEAFKVEANTTKDAIKVDIKLGDKIHIYKDALKFSITKPTKEPININLPPAKKIGNDEVYEGNLTILVPFNAIKQKGDVSFRVNLRGCSDAGLCYAPQTYDFNLTIPKSATIASAVSSETKANEEGFFSKISTLAKSGNSKQIVEALKNEGIGFILLLFFIVGLLLALTPCILPMVPILSSIILKQAKSSEKGELSRAESFIISLVYVVSMAIAYAIIGVVAGLLDFDLQANANNPWVIIPIALIFVALAFSLFGYYELALPAKLQTKLNNISNKAQGKGYLGTAIMGAISALVVGACTAPVISGAIIFISITGDALLGGLALFVMGLGAGMPLLLLGLGAKNLVPKPGGWMENVSKVFGFLMLLMALYIARGIMSPTLFMFSFSFLVVGAALYFGALDSNYKGFLGIFKVANFFMFIWGILIFIGAISGAKSILNPLEPFMAKGGVTSVANLEHEAKSYTLQELLDEIKNAKKPVVIDIGKENCAACSELNNITFPHPEVKKEMERFKFIKLDVTKYTKDDQAILKHFKLFGAPNILIFNSKGEPLEDKFIQGFIEPEKFKKVLKEVK